jgi:hypothetical protein
VPAGRSSGRTGRRPTRAVVGDLEHDLAVTDPHRRAWACAGDA